MLKWLLMGLGLYCDIMFFVFALSSAFESAGIFGILLLIGGLIFIWRIMKV